MLAEFSIYPMRAEHMSRDVAKVIETLEGMGLKYHLGPMSTAVEGSWEQVIEAIDRCHQVVALNHDHSTAGSMTLTSRPPLRPTAKFSPTRATTAPFTSGRPRQGKRSAAFRRENRAARSPCPSRPTAGC